MKSLNDNSKRKKKPDLDLHNNAVPEVQALSIVSSASFWT